MTSLHSNPTNQKTTDESPKSQSVPFTVHSTTECINVPMTTGLCMPKGHSFKVSHAEVQLHRHGVPSLADATSIDADANVLNRWHDGSVRWIQLDFVVPSLSEGQTEALAVFRPSTVGTKKQLPPTSVSIKDHCFLMSLNGRKILVDTLLVDQHGNTLQLSPASIQQPSKKSHRQQWEALLDVVGHPDIELKLTFNVWPETATVDVSSRIRNKQRAIHAGGLWDLGDAGSFHFKQLNIKLSAVRLQNSQLTVNLNGPSSTMDHTDGPFTLVQHSSGAANWNSSSHVNSDGQVTVQQKGFEVTAGTRKGEGLQASPTVCLANNDGQLQVAVPEFWQQFPNSMTCEPDFGTASVGLFPQQTAETYELQGGEQKTKRFVFCMKNQSESSADNTLSWVHASPRIVPDANWVRKCDVIPWLPNTKISLNSNADHHHRLAKYLESARTGKRSLAKRREAIDEYGWRNFGDIHADHEQTHFAGSGTVVSHYNNQFDLVFGAIQNLIVSGDVSWFDLFDPMARHVMDIDIYHTDQDRACFNGGLFWHTDHYVDAQTATHRTYSKKNAGEGGYGGGPSNEHNYPTGLMYYHFLTGNEEARECVLSLADWVINMDDGQQTLFAALDSDNTGLASKTVSDDFHGPGRGVGNSINACLDGWILTADSRYMAKAEQLIMRCVHPNQNCDELHLADAEGHWSYTVCLTALGRYLHVKVSDNQLDETYEYVRQTLVHYGNWMAKNEKPSLSVPEELQYPTEAWAAQDFRKANALRIAASCCHDNDQASTMIEAADSLQEAAWTDLYRFGDAHHSARCLSIIMTEGLRQLFHESTPSAPFPIGDQKPTTAEWTMFELQKHRVKNILKNPVQLAKAVLKNVRPTSIRQSWDALRRQRAS